jgi:adenine-specific DNA-methyltransferase
MARKKNGPASRKQSDVPTPVEATKHKDARTNIPTREQGAMMASDEASPKTLLYPRDPSLDPQLVWKGKDEQDRQPLEVAAVPVYIQEKIHPRAIIEDLRERAESGKPKQPDLFSDFNGLENEPVKRTEFYQHDQHWTNRLILGDSLLVMTSLAEKERLKGRVQMIYMDPPYGIKFGSNWQVSTRKREVKDAKAEDLTRQPEQIKAFRDTWQLGIHSYLTYLRDRLVVARELLTESGSLFVQIGDENVHLVRCLLDEVFGSENFVNQIVYAKTTGATVVLLPGTADYILWYAKKIESVRYRQVFLDKVLGEEGATKYDQVEAADGTRRALTKEERETGHLGGRAFTLGGMTSQSVGREKGEGAACWFKVEFEGKHFTPDLQSRWKTNEIGMRRLIAARRLQVMGRSLRYVRFIDDFPAYPISNTWLDIGGIQSRSDPKIYVVQTSTTAVQRSLLMSTDPGDLVLDPTCGSGTTAYVAEQWGRRWITIDTSRVALTLARTRLMAARFAYHLLADSLEGRRKEAEIAGQPINGSPGDAIGRDIRNGFVYKRVPHVTLKSIANNPDIHEGMTREQIDAAIRKHAETETLYDQPYEDKNIVRVAGPFTVESLSPHRVLAAQDGGDEPRRSPDSPADFVPTILDNLRKAGVQNTKRNERLVFDRLDPYAGEYLQAEGTYSENGKTKRAAVCVGPEFGTVSPDLLAAAAREAHRGIGFDLLLVCGFAFDPHVAEEGKVIEKQVGRIKVLLVRMNPDLAMGDELLKKTGAGNLFLVFGEPDVAIEKQKDGKLVIEVRGVDVFDPTTGEIRSSGTDQIACWFIDTDYNGESFFVRHAYFLGGQEPYEKLKRALRAEIDEAEWAKLYSARSVVFESPKKGKIAVKVINHYGDEVLKVYPVGK